VRRLCAWFDVKMNAEVTENLLGEKMMKRYFGHGQPNSNAIRAGHANLPYHLEYIGFLVERRRWLAGDHFSVADITAAAQLSSLDYLGDVPWDDHELAKEWYARIKSRPSFRQILADHLPAYRRPALHRPRFLVRLGRESVIVASSALHALRHPAKAGTIPTMGTGLRRCDRVGGGG